MTIFETIVRDEVRRALAPPPAPTVESVLADIEAVVRTASRDELVRLHGVLSAIVTAGDSAVAPPAPRPAPGRVATPPAAQRPEPFLTFQHRAASAPDPKPAPAPPADDIEDVTPAGEAGHP